MLEQEQSASDIRSAAPIRAQLYVATAIAPLMRLRTPTPSDARRQHAALAYHDLDGKLSSTAIGYLGIGRTCA